MKMHRSFDTIVIFRRIAATVLVGASLIAVSACGAQSNANDQKNTQNSTTTTKAQDPITVVASVNQWGSLAQEIGGDHVKVTSIISNSTVEPHDYEASTAEIAQLTSAQVAVLNGADYDAWATKAVSSAKSVSVVNAASIIGASSSDNPHLWFSKDARKAVADELLKTYSTLLPASKSYFQKQYDAWAAEEKKLDTKLEEFKKSENGKKYAATESVAYYLFSDMGLTDATPEGYANSAANEAEPTAADLQEFQSLIESHGIDLLVNNPQESSDATNILTGTAGKSNVPVVDVTEQLPSEYKTLAEWITALVDNTNKSLSDSAQ